MSVAEAANLLHIYHEKEPVHLKRAFALLLLTVHLFNFGACLIVHQFLVFRSDRFFDEQTAKNLYNKQDLVEIAIPVNIPGLQDWARYEKISGQIQFEDNAYNYVQMKITGHALYLKCVPNYKTTRLNTENIIRAKGIKDIPVPKKEHVPYTGILFLEGFSTNHGYTVLAVPFTSLPRPTVTYPEPLFDRHIDIPKQPPKQFS